MKKKWIIIIVCCITLAICGKLYHNHIEKKEAERLYQEQIVLRREKLLLKSDKLISHLAPSKAIDLLMSDEKIMNETVQAKIDEYKKIKDSYVLYEGFVEHIFFHSLIVYPELAFDNIGHDKDGYNMWFTTVEETKKILQKLYENDFVLVSIHDLFYLDENQTMKKKELYLPEGKKPIIISQDDVCYYDYMDPDGFASRLVIDNNEVSTLVRTPGNEYITTRDGDLVPILDDFVEEHPDFSYGGAKGIIALTGYEGILGYHNITEEAEEIKEVVELMKENGWDFASHSYTHRSKYFNSNPDIEGLLYDLEQWDKQIKPLLGDIDIFIAPFGAELPSDTMSYFVNYGFRYYFTVDRPMTYYKNRGSYVLLPRFNLDGYTITYDQKRIISRLFNPEGILDTRRPPVKQDA